MPVRHFRTFTFAFLTSLLFGCQCPPGGQTDSGGTAEVVEHPFLGGMEGVVTDKELPPAPATTRTVPEGLVATNTRTVPAKVTLGTDTLDVKLEATPDVPADQLEVLAATLTATPIDRRDLKQLERYAREEGQLQRGEPEVRLPLVRGPNGQPVLLVPADGWEIVRPLVVRLEPEYAKGKVGKADHVDNKGVGTTTQALTGSWEQVRGTLTCKPTTTEPAVPLPFVTVEIGGTSVQADANGEFVLDRSITEVNSIRVIYEGRVRVGSASSPMAAMHSTLTSAPMMVMNEWHEHRSEEVDTPTGTTTGTTLDLGTIQVASLDCELFQLGTIALAAFMVETTSPPPAGNFRIKRWWGVDVGTPYAYYDYVVIATDFLEDYNTRQNRRETIFHEFGHTVRHAADGDGAHWGWDNFRWAYARNHSGNEIFNEQYAVNEGWAQYWECTDPLRTGTCPSARSDLPSAVHVDWNEWLIGRRLRDLAAVAGVGDATMVRILTSNRGGIHTLMEFEQAYCQFVAIPNPYCNADRSPVRTKSSCPPDFHDDGATCRFENIRAKPSYGRGVGTVPTGCGTNEENDAGLCYADCEAGYDGVGPVCWKRCPAGYHDDGAFCRKDVHIIGSNNGSCPWYDVCGLTFAAGCSTCPSGYHNDGCTCRRDAHIFAKDTYGRGVGTIPTDCGGGKVYDAGLCYPPCNAGFTGVGPVCWGSCDPGWDDHGATCYKPPNILVKY